MKYSGLFVALVAFGCQSLPDVEPGVCGNKVVEEGEDCDGFAAGGAQCGNPGTATGCFFVCDASDLENAPCPSGYGCGADGRCRRPSGEFVMSSQLSFPVPDFKIADIDGDGAPDLVGSSQNRLHVAFGDGAGGIANKLDFPSAADRGLFSLGDLDGDGRTDIVAATEAGITAFLGRFGQKLEPVTYPSFTLPPLESIKIFVARGRFGGLKDSERLFGFLDNGSSGSITELTESGLGAPVSKSVADVFGAGFDVSSIFTPVAVGHTDLDANDEMAVTHFGATAVWIVDLDTGVSQRDVSATQLDLPSPFRAAGRAFLADFNGSGGLDVVLPMRDSATNEVALGVALNNGTGGFGAVTVQSDRVDQPVELLEVANLDGDAFADFVFSTGVVLGDGGPINIFDLGDVVITGDWSAAGIVDINADGRSDVVAVPDAAPGLEVYLQTPGGLYNRFLVGSSAFFQGNGEVIAGDFDGDFISDVALSSRAPGAGAQLEVLFGSPGGGFDAPVKMASFESVEQLVVVGRLEDQGADGIDDLVVLGTQTGSEVVATMQGDSSRSMVSPLFLVESQVVLHDGDEPKDVLYAPLQAIIGQVGDTVGVMATTLSLGAAASAGDDCSKPFFGCSWAWVLPGLGDGQLDASAASIMPLEQIPGPELGCHFWETADLDSDGSDEMLGVTSNRVCPDITPEVELVAPGSAPTDLEIPGGVGGLGDFATADLDGDGNAEILTIYGGDGGAGGVIVYWNESGNFASPELLDAVDAQPLSVAAGHLDGDAFSDLVFSGVEGNGFEELPAIYISSYDATAGAYSPPQRHDELGRGLAVGTADLDEDGVDDIVVADGVGATIYLGKPAPPGGGSAAPASGEEGQ